MIFGSLTRIRGLSVLFLLSFGLLFVLIPLGMIPFFVIEGDLVKFADVYVGLHKAIAAPFTSDHYGDVLVTFTIAAAVLAAVQVVFLAPLVGSIHGGETSRSLRASMLAAAFIAALIAAGLVLALTEGVVLWCGLYESSVLSELGEEIALLVMGLAWLTLTAAWTWALWRVGSSRDPEGIARAARQLLAGTALEVVLALPIYALARKKSDCYCAMPGFYALCLGMVSLFTLCGPFAVLFLTRAARRNWARGACRGCGYPRRSGAASCTECGHAFATD